MPRTIGCVQYSPSMTEPRVSELVPDFQQELKENDTAIMADLSNRDSRVLQVAFGGIHGGVGIAPFEFYKLTSAFPTKKLYVRDPNQTWYHGELPEIGNGIPALVKYLNDIIRAQNCERVVFFGNSMGGYAAILLGWLLKVDRVIAFAPQTFINRGTRFWQRDGRWKTQIENTYRSASANAAYFDLKSLLEKSKRRAQIDIYFDIGDRLDRAHAFRLANVPQVTLHDYNVGGHDLVKYLRNQGTLGEILLNALSAQSQKGT